MTAGQRLTAPISWPVRVLYFPDNTYEIFSYGDPARSYALEAQPDVSGAFAGSEVDLHTVWPPDPYTANPNQKYSIHYWHSAEFRGDYPEEVGFWRAVLGVDGFNLK